jgi:hypothetical protein
MAIPMTPDQWRAQLRKFDVPFREIDGWDSATSGRDDETGKEFGPVHGVVIHHTGDDAPDTADRNVIINGRSDLPGPLAQSGLNDDGVVDLITPHRANHAGGGDPDVLMAIVDESYNDYPPATHEHEGSAGSIDGNDCFYGIETYYSGGHSMTPAQYDSAVGWAAAICDFHGWSAKSVIGHKEWSDWKVDPGHVDMKEFRADVQQRINQTQGARMPTVRNIEEVTATTNSDGDVVDYDVTNGGHWPVLGVVPSPDDAFNVVIRASAGTMGVQYRKNFRCFKRLADGTLAPNANASVRFVFLALG